MTASDPVLHRTHTPLHVWFWVAFLRTTATPGVSAVPLARQLGLERYEAAWVILHKLGRAMVNPEREPLSGAVEVDDSFVGGHEAGLRGEKALVFSQFQDREFSEPGPWPQDSCPDTPTVGQGAS